MIEALERMMPTFDPARSSSMNPFAADLELNKIVRYAEEITRKRLNLKRLFGILII